MLFFLKKLRVVEKRGRGEEKGNLLGPPKAKPLKVPVPRRIPKTKPRR